MTGTRAVKRILMVAALAASAWGQAPQGGPASEPPDAERTKQELSNLLDHYPPTLRNVLAMDPSLAANQAYLAPYPGLVTFLNARPEVVRNPSFYFGSPREDRRWRGEEVWRDITQGVAVFGAFGMAIGLLVWLIRTFVDYRRWSRLAKVQTDAHTKLLDRFTSNEDLLAYIQTPTGAKFLQSSPITLDAAPRSVGAPMARILWSVQGGVVLVAGGIGLQIVAAQIPDAVQPLRGMGVLGIALGLGFVFSAIISYVISERLGLIEPATPASKAEFPGA